MKDAVDIIELEEKVMYMLCRDENNYEIYEDEPPVKPGATLDGKSVMGKRSQLLSKNKSMKKNKAENSIISSKKAITMRLRVKTGSINFGIFRMIFVLLLLILGMMVVQYLFYIALYPSAHTLS